MSRPPRSFKLLPLVNCLLFAVGGPIGTSSAGGQEPAAKESKPQSAQAARGGVLFKMPGESFSGELPPFTEQELSLAKGLRSHVEELAGKIGERSIQKPAQLLAAANYIDATFVADGYKKVERQKFMERGRECENLSVEITGTKTPTEIVVIGAHYDSRFGTVGANDNGSGSASMLELARIFAKTKPARTLRFVAFANEEQPKSKAETMGSMVYARSLKERGDRVVAMLSLETMGYYSDEPKSQQYPPPASLFYPSTGNFIGFVANVKSAELVQRVVKRFRETTKFPSEGGALPEELPGVGWSDHWGFWQMGYPALMVTDTAPFRYPYYHKVEDTPDKIDYNRLARVVLGLEQVISDLAGVDAKILTQ